MRDGQLRERRERVRKGGKMGQPARGARERGRNARLA